MLPVPGRFKLVILLAGLSLLTCPGWGQEVPSREGFRAAAGKKYNEALVYLWSNPWISDTLQAAGVDPQFAAAIVFPEVVRYSLLRDRMEVMGLLSLYVKYGRAYADFSVGRFQMKPSFLEQVEADAVENRIPAKVAEETPQTRLERVKRLGSPEWQVKYLAAFINILDARFKHKNWSSTEEKLKFYATAYNAGYTNSEACIRELIPAKTFYTTLLPGEPRYAYAEIACEYFSLFGKNEKPIIL